MTNKKTAPIGAGNPQKASSELEAAVKEKLRSDVQLEAAGITVSADVTRNQVTLSGTVGSEEQRRKAVEAAKSAQAGVVVQDGITVKSDARSAAP